MAGSTDQYRKHRYLHVIPSHDILHPVQPKADGGFDWEDATNNAVDGAINIVGNQHFQDENHRTVPENVFDSLNYQGLSTRFDTNGYAEVDGFRLHLQFKGLTGGTSIWPLDQPARAKTEMVKLLKDVARIRVTNGDERFGLARFAKGKVAAQEEYQKLRIQGPHGYTCRATY